MKTTLEKLRMAESQLNNAVVALREAAIDANNVTGDCILPLIGRAADLRRDVSRLADMVNLDIRGDE